MKVSLVGYGKMGKAIEEVASQEGVSVVSRIDPNGSTQIISPESVSEADVCIEFTHPDAVFANIESLAKLGKPMVIGTTGWDHRLDEVRALADHYRVGVIYAENFSLGMQCFLKLVQQAAILVDQMDLYDVSGYEIHHRNKADSPSGTALAIADTLLNNIQRKKEVLFDRPEGKIAPEKIHFSSLRCGSNPGTHTVMIDSPFDSITLTHEARNREGLAKGALEAGKWIQGKTGLYHFREILN